MSLVTYDNRSFDIMGEIYKQRAHAFLDITKYDFFIFTGVFLNVKTVVKLRLLGVPLNVNIIERRSSARLKELLK